MYNYIGCFARGGGNNGWGSRFFSNIHIIIIIILLNGKNPEGEKGESGRGGRVSLGPPLCIQPWQ